MQAVSYSDARKNLKHYLDDVYNNHDPLIITRKNNENVVVLSLDDYNSISETHFLLSNEHNKSHLLKSLESARSNKVIKKDLIEE